MNIILPADPDSVERFACKELKKYLSGIGCDCSIGPDIHSDRGLFRGFCILTPDS